jgi:D-alanyl-D-alanine carboxypeptidase (penicillin-binding protein 5/6)
MHRRLVAGAVALAAVLPAAGVVGSTSPASAVSRSAPRLDGTTLLSVPAGAVDAHAWLLADADTGAVLAAYNDHERLRPASVAKILTAYVAIRALPADSRVPVGADAAGEEAMKMNMKVGQDWTLNDTLHALLMVSANDAAVALADRVSGSPARFALLAEEMAGALGVRDHPTLDDPAGLDDSFQIGQGDLMSAYDLAVIARAAMTLPEFSSIVRLKHYYFTGPDNIQHELPNHNRLVSMDPTVVGIKPGYTDKAGETLVTEATRGGRSMLVVELNASIPTEYSGAEALFAAGFATPVSSEDPVEMLPAVARPRVDTSLEEPPAVRAAIDASQPAGHPSAHPASVSPVVLKPGGHGLRDTTVVVVALLCGGVAARRRQIRARRRRRARARAALAAVDRGSAGQEAQDGVDGPEVLRSGEVVHPRQHHQLGVRQGVHQRVGRSGEVRRPDHHQDRAGDPTQTLGV